MAVSSSLEPGPATWRLARLYLRARVVRVAALLITAIAGLTVASASIISQTTPTPQQLVAWSVGTYDYAISVPAELAPGDTEGLAHYRRLAAELDPAAGVMLTSTSIPTQFGRERRIAYIEADWTQCPLPDRYRLTAGRWATSPAEVTASTRTGLAVGDTITVFDGAASLTVVGLAMDAASHGSSALYAPPGQWASYAGSDLATRYPETSTNVDIFYSGTDEDQAITILNQDTGAGRDLVPNDITSRAALAQTQRNIASVRLPIAGVLPLLLVPVVAGAALGIVVGSWNSRARRQLFALGIPSRLSAGAVTAATVAAGLLGWWVGALVGNLLTAVARPLIAGLTFTDLADWRIEWVYVGLSALALTFTSMLGLAASPGLGTAARVIARLGAWRRPFAGVLILALIVAVPNASKGIGMSIIGVLACLAIALFSPDFMAPVIGRLHSHDLSLTLAGRVLRQQRVVATAAMVSLVAVQALLATTVSIADTQIAAANAAQVASVPPGFLVLRSIDEGEVPASIRNQVEAATGLRDPIVARDVMVSTDDLNGAIIAVPDIAAAERLIGHPLTAAQRQVLQTGVAAFNGFADASLTVTTMNGHATDVPSVPITAPRELGEGGLALASAPFVKQSQRFGQTLYYPASPELLSQEAPNLAKTLRIDSQYIDYYRTPRPYQIDDTIIAAVVLFGGLAVLIFAGYQAALARRLRPYLASLRALGIPGRWRRKLVAGLVLGPLIGATISAALAVWVSTVLLWVAFPEQYLLQVPLIAYVPLILVSAAAAVIGSLVAANRVRVTERTLEAS